MGDLRLEDRIGIGAPLDRVWQLLLDVRGWRLWWPDVRHAKTHDLKRMREGSTISVDHHAGPIRLSSRLRVRLVLEEKSVSWDARCLGIGWTHAWYVDRRDEQTRLTSRMVWPGGTGLALRLLGRRKSLEARHQTLLKGIKRVAERLV